MRRAPFVGAATVAGLIGVLSFHTKTLSSSLSSPATTAPPRSTSHSTPPSTAAPAGGAPSGGSGSSASGGTTPTTKAPPTTAGPSSTATATGSLEQYGYGELDVKVTVSGGRIRDITVPKLLVADQYSQQLAQAAIPMLRSEVLKAQSANISSVSGATYTSEAYTLSLQAALKKLHFA
ncbi:MAG: FMN-binding protein [Actinomycetota bacterium]|jgi:uncharacterized protein with FMN-binding domain|nr:FMN-binding protein [Actinomycetota bacterium]